MNNESLLFDFGMSFICGGSWSLLMGRLMNINLDMSAICKQIFGMLNASLSVFFPRQIHLDLQPLSWISDYVPQLSILWLKAPAGKSLVDIHDIDDKISFMF
jgi:hypothetical protein